MKYEPGRVAQSIGHLTRKSEVLGSITGLATYFLLPLIQEGQLSITGESMCTDRPDMTLDVYRGRKTRIQQKIMKYVCFGLQISLMSCL